tara:strand:- start:1047 stop:1826 length:780 start_codon:yes stop_codon:yes gene_type:complete
MGQYVKFEASKIFKSLNILEESQLKYSSNKALRKLGYSLKSSVIPTQMKRNFIIGDQAAPYTLNSIRYGIIDNDTLEISVNEAEGKGNAPAKYLFPPMVAGGAAYTTRFTKALRAQKYLPESGFAIPNKNGIGVGRKKVAGWFYAQTLAGLASSDRRIGSSSPRNLSKRANRKKTTQMGRVISVPLDQRDIKAKGIYKNEQQGGIYRVKGDNVNKLFNYTYKEPQVPQTYDYYRLVTETAKQIFPDIWLKEIRAAIDSK